MPLYLSKDHYESAKGMIEDAFFCIVMGASQTKEGREGREGRDLKPHESRAASGSRSFSSHINSSVKMMGLSSPRRSRSKSVDTMTQKSKVRRRTSSDFEHNVFHPDMALMVLGMLMNEVLANAISEKLHPFKALETYCVFHRLLLAFSAKVSANLDLI